MLHSVLGQEDRELDILDAIVYDFENNLELQGIEDNEERSRTNERSTKSLLVYRRLQKLPNVHIGTYYPVIAKEYS